MNGYIQAEVLGRRRGLKFGMLAAQQIMLQAQRLNKTFGNELDLVLVPVIVYWGLWNNCYNKQEDPDFTFEQVSEWVDENIDKPDLFAEIVRCFYESKVVAASIDKLKAQAGDDEKKSSTSPQSADGMSSGVSSQEKSVSETTTG